MHISNIICLKNIFSNFTFLKFKKFRNKIKDIYSYNLSSISLSYLLKCPYLNQKAKLHNTFNTYLVCNSVPAIIQSCPFQIQLCTIQKLSEQDHYFLYKQNSLHHLMELLLFSILLYIQNGQSSSFQLIILKLRNVSSQQNLQQFYSQLFYVSSF